MRGAQNAPGSLGVPDEPNGRSLSPGANSQPALSIPIPEALIEEIAARAAEIVVERLQVERMQEQQLSPYMTIPEAATWLRCSRQRVDDLLSQRRLSRIKDGRRTLVLRSEIESYLAAGQLPRRCPDGRNP